MLTDTNEPVTEDHRFKLRSAVGARTAHGEHTIVISEDGTEVLTMRG